MNRQEAINIIAEKLREDNSELTFEQLAKEILDLLEFEIKMIPPSLYIEAFKRYDNGWSN